MSMAEIASKEPGSSGKPSEPMSIRTKRWAGKRCRSRPTAASVRSAPVIEPAPSSSQRSM